MTLDYPGGFKVMDRFLTGGSEIPWCKESVEPCAEGGQAAGAGKGEQRRRKNPAGCFPLVAPGSARWSVCVVLCRQLCGSLLRPPPHTNAGSDCVRAVRNL